MVPLIRLLEAVVLCIYSHDSQIVLKIPLTLTISEITTLSFLWFGTMLLFTGRKGREDTTVLETCTVLEL